MVLATVVQTALVSETLFDNKARVLTSIGVGLIILVISIMSIKRAQVVVSILAGIGAFWASWTIYNLIIGSNDNLFGWAPDVSHLDRLFTAASILPAILFLGVIAASYAMFLATKKTNDNADNPVIIRLGAAVGIFFAGLLLIPPVTWLLVTAYEIWQRRSV